MSVQQLSTGRWRVQIRRKGFPKYDKVFLTEQAARDAEATVLGEQRTVESPAEITLQQAWERYSQSQDFLQKAENTQKTEQTRIKPVLDELGGYSVLNLERAPHLIYDYIDKRAVAISPKTRRRMSPTSIRLEIAALSAVVAWAQQRRIIRSNFISTVKRPGQSKRKRRVTVTELNKLGELIFDEDSSLAEASRFVLILRYLGCRPGELASLLRADVDLLKAEILFRRTKYEREDRRVHVTESALEYLDVQLFIAKESAPNSPYVFSTPSRKKNPDGTPIFVKYNYSYGITLLRGVGVVDPSFHAHALRREFVSRAIEDGLPYATIRKQTGHHSTQAIEIYDEGLSTAPEIRAALDKHDSNVAHDLESDRVGTFVQAALEKGFTLEELHKLGAISGEDLERLTPQPERKFFSR